MSSFTVDRITSPQDTNVVLKVRVCYRKELSTKNSPGNIWKLEFVFIDITGNKIQGSVQGTSLITKFGNLLTEGSLVEIKGVAINQNVEYRTTRHRFRIQLHMKSMVSRIVNEPPIIPMFHFEEFNDIKAAPANFKDFNIDVIGYITITEESTTTMVGNVNAEFMKVVVQNLDNDEIQFTLLGDHVHHLKNILADRKDQNVVYRVAILQMGGVKTFGAQPPTVQTVRNQSRFLTDTSIPEIAKYLEKLMKRPEKELTASSIVNHMESSSSQMFIDNIQSGTVPIVNIADLQDLPAGEYWIMGEIMDVDTQYHWSYLSCKKCTLRVDRVDGLYSCSPCKISFSKPFFRYKLSLLIHDHTGHDNFKFWDKTTIMLTDVNATELRMLNEGRPRHEVPEELTRLFGRTLLLKASNVQRKKDRLQDLNVKHLIIEEETILKYKKTREQQLQEEDNEEVIFHDLDDADDADGEQLPNDSIGDNEPSSSKQTPKRRRYIVDDDEDDEDVAVFKDVDVDVDLALKSDGKTQHSTRRLYKKLNEEFKDDDQTDDDE